MGRQYIIGLVPDPVRSIKAALTFNTSSGALIQTIGERGKFLGWHEGDEGEALIEIFRAETAEELLADLDETGCVVRIPLPGNHPWIFEADGYIKQPSFQDDSSPGITA